jgi:hypothetical protein
MKRIFRHPVLGALLLASVAAHAQFMTGVNIEPARPAVGVPTRITASFDVKDDIVNCGLRVRYSDGTAEDYHRLNQSKDVPLRLTHTFSKPGEHTVWFEPRTKVPTFRCGGGDLALKVMVAP